MAFAIGWTTCIGPVFAAILTAAAASEGVWRGAALLFVNSLGTGFRSRQRPGGRGPAILRAAQRSSFALDAPDAGRSTSGRPSHRPAGDHDRSDDEHARDLPRDLDDREPRGRSHPLGLVRI